MPWLLAVVLLASLPACVELAPRCGGDSDCEDGQLCTDGSCTVPPPQPTGSCGDRIQQSELGESCDAGSENGKPGSSCRVDCTAISCGDGTVDLGEACDAGTANGEPGSECTLRCITSTCGDGRLDPDMAERCDDGAANSEETGRCSTSCTPTCGDGRLQPGLELCDPGASTGWCGPTCRAACDSGPVKACASAGLSAAVTADGSLFTWGANGAGQLGELARGAFDPTPRRVLPGQLWAAVACGEGFVLALGRDGTAWSWGAGGTWLGRPGNTDPAPAPVEHAGPWAQLSTSGRGVLAIDVEGGLQFWGEARYGAQGNGRGFVTTFWSAQRLLPERRWSTVAAGPAYTSFAIDADGTLFAWGRNDVGQLGLGDTEDRDVPTAVGAAGLPRFRAVAAGRAHTLAVGEDGTLWAFGDGAGGALGRAAAAGPAVTPVPFAPERSFSGAAAGDATSFGVAADGALIVAGRNRGAQYGILGLGTVGEVEAPARVGEEHDLRVAAAAAARSHVLLPLAGAGLLATGADLQGALGPGPHTTLVPRPVPGLCGCTSDDDCAGGGSCTAGVCGEPGAPAACGDAQLQPERGERCDEGAENGSGAGRCDATCAGIERCGDGVLDPGEECDPAAAEPCTPGCTTPRCGDGEVSPPELSDDGSGCAACGLPGPGSGGQLAATKRRSAYVSPDGRLWVFGADAFGTLGWSEDEALAPELTRPVRAPIPGPILAVALALSHSLVLDREGLLWSFGQAGPALGAGPAAGERFPPPRPVAAPPASRAIAAGHRSSLAVDRSGALWFFGAASSLGTTPAEDVPYPAVLPPGRISRITLGLGSAYAVDEDGIVFVWGENAQGQLGLDGVTEAALPTPLPGLPPIARIAAGSSHALFLARDGRLFGTGLNSFGQLCHPTSGPGGFGRATHPVEIPWGRPLLRVAAGETASLALDDTGAGFGCGRNSAGGANDSRNVLGNGDPTDQHLPAPIVAPDRRLVEVATSGSHSLFLDDAGHLLATGHGESGELGLGDVVQLDVPTEVPVPCE